MSEFAHMTLWFAGCTVLMVAPPAIVIAARPLKALAGVIATCAGWALLLRVAPSDLGMAGEMLLFSVWGLSIFTTIAAVVIRAPACERL